MVCNCYACMTDLSVHFKVKLFSSSLCSMTKHDGVEEGGIPSAAMCPVWDSNKAIFVAGTPIGLVEMFLELTAI